MDSSLIFRSYHPKNFAAEPIHFSQKAIPIMPLFFDPKWVFNNCDTPRLDTVVSSKLRFQNNL